MTVSEIISSGLLDLYVLGQTNESETAKVLEWKNNYPEVAAEIEKIEIAMEQYALAHAVPPSAKVKDALFSKIKKESKAEAKVLHLPTSNINKWKWLSAASFALLLFSGITAITFYNKYKNASSQLTILSQTEAKTNEQLNYILASNTEPLQLKGTAVSPTSTAKIFWVKNTGDVYVAANGLPETPNGMQYQLWAIIEGKPVNAGMIINNKKGDIYKIQKMKSFGKAEAFAITLEKTGGSPTPSMDKMYVISKTT